MKTTNLTLAIVTFLLVDVMIENLQNHSLFLPFLILHFVHISEGKKKPDLHLQIDSFQYSLCPHL